ncbi:uncharacterized protein K441DRAFT_669206 [Cenococcum geophilum 1.58]|uniref:Uncharacterized protein n=1 Tax=Cenococcum geophilum 1.58 TaxID=794803 RepID=A0ACC8EQA5_9PEZI|nr:hypothetical protein K441DRAFT_669206 [Cenococcum geophilum 1.58]
MELAARVVDLTRALLDTANSESGAQEVVRLVHDWLTREGVDQKEYKYCLSSIGGIAFPNERGLSLRSCIQSADQKMSTISGLKLRLSAAIGRSMAFDDNFTYIVTTVATLMAFYSLEYITEALCYMALDQGGHEEEINIRYSIRQTRLTPVLRKFVESVALHVVNAGSTLQVLPPELQKFYVHKHPLSPETFSALTMAIQRSNEEMLITCTNFPHDLTSWLLSHFHGNLEISVCGLVVYEEALGRVPKNLRIIVKTSCESASKISCASFSEGSVEMAARVGGSYQTLINELSCHTVAQPVDRQKLYTTSILYHRQHEILNSQETAEVHLAAQCMLKWLLDIEVRPHPHSVGFIALQGREDESRFNKRVKIQDLVARYPSFVFKNKGQKKDNMIVYRIPDGCPALLHSQSGNDVIVWSGYPHHDAYQDLAEHSWKSIIECFPIAISAIEWAKSRCTCSSCAKGEPLGSGKIGCLRDAALDELLFLLAHGIVDSFGLDDTSGLIDMESQKDALRVLLAELIFQSVILWNAWFSFTALAYLGGTRSALNSRRGDGWNVFAAFQYGNLVIASPWLDLNHDINGRLFFGAFTSQGQLCGVSGEFAAIQTEKVMETAEIVRSDSASSEVDENEARPDDAVLETAIIGAAGIPFRLLTMVRSCSYRRIVDPADAIMGLYRAIIPKCNHLNDMYGKISKAHYREFTFDQILGEWNKDYISTQQSASFDESRKRNVTVTFDTALKYNVALSLAYPESVVHGDQCCAQCAITILKNDGELPSSIIRTVAKVGTRMIENS